MSSLSTFHFHVAHTYRHWTVLVTTAATICSKCPYYRSGCYSRPTHPYLASMTAHQFLVSSDTIIPWLKVFFSLQWQCDLKNNIEEIKQIKLAKLTAIEWNWCALSWVREYPTRSRHWACEQTGWHFYMMFYNTWHRIIWNNSGGLPYIIC